MDKVFFIKPRKRNPFFFIKPNFFKKNKIGRLGRVMPQFKRDYSVAGIKGENK